jgi:ribonuclease HI
MRFEVYTDGSTKNNGYENSVGGWAYSISEGGNHIKSESGAELNTTNQRMELTAAVEALDYLFYNEVCVPFDFVEVYTDSAYLHNCYTQKWYENWQNNGWKNSKKQPVANQDLWERLVKYFEMPEVKFVKVKGHADVHWNNYVDELAQGASANIKKIKEVI